ncbi:MAG: hypothetical protein FWD33_01495 [Alphaproteobacteria bacterium]|nr:hypothetical protein [Alphaproteobacteria bacterium]
MKKLIPALLAIFAASCARNTPSVISYCEPIYGRAVDWEVISDDLARAIYRHNLICWELDGLS